jgi:hypothetical protein
MNVYTFTIGASHTPAALLAVAGTGLPFDLLDTVASLLFGLAFGPELARLLTRTRARMDISWEPVAARLAVLALLVLTTACLWGAMAAHRASAASLSPELSFLTSAQNSDGGFGAARGQRSGELYTAWSAIGLAAASRSPASVRRGGRSVLDSLRGEASTLQGLGDAERTVLAARACGASAYSFAGRDLVAEVMLARARDNSFAHQVNLTAFAILALRAAGHSSGFRPIREAAGWIERQQGADGGFGFGGHGSPSDVDDTGATLQALAAAGAHNARALGAAIGYLLRSQSADGGFPQRYGGESNAQSTAWAVQGLIAAGRDPATVRRRGSRSPLGYLESLLAPGGSVRYSRTSAQTPVWVTAQAMIALAGKTFPVDP